MTLQGKQRLNTLKQPSRPHSNKKTGFQILPAATPSPDTGVDEIEPGGVNDRVIAGIPFPAKTGDVRLMGEKQKC